MRKPKLRELKEAFGRKIVFNGAIDVVSADPPIALSVPATLTVIGVADAATDPANVDFGTKYVGYPYTYPLLVRNIGTGALTVNAVTSNDPNLIVLEPVTGTGVYVIPAGESLEYTLRWLAPSPYTMAATVTVDTDDPDEPLLYVPVTGTAIMPTGPSTPMPGSTPPTKIPGGSNRYCKTTATLSSGAQPCPPASIMSATRTRAA